MYWITNTLHSMWPVSWGPSHSKCYLKCPVWTKNFLSSSVEPCVSRGSREFASRRCSCDSHKAGLAARSVNGTRRKPNQLQDLKTALLDSCQGGPIWKLTIGNTPVNSNARSLEKASVRSNKSLLFRLLLSLKKIPLVLFLRLQIRHPFSFFFLYSECFKENILELIF